MTVVAKTPDAADELAAVEIKEGHAIQKYIIPRHSSQAAIRRRQVLTDSLVIGIHLRIVVHVQHKFRF